MSLIYFASSSRPLRWLTVSFIALLVHVSAGVSSADDVIFTIDQSQSTETWSGVDQTYGTVVPQSTGSLTTSVFGHFVVAFDPTTDTPTSMQFIGGTNASDGYFQLANSTTNFAPGNAPANVAGKTSGGQLDWSVRNIVWDFSSGAIAGSNGNFPATSTSFQVASGGADFQYAGASAYSDSYVGVTDSVTTGTWNLTQSPPGSGNWTLTLNGTYDYGYLAGGVAQTNGSLEVTGHIVSTAHYAASNSTVVQQSISPPPKVDLLGGSTQTGGVSLNLPQGETGGLLTVQQVPGLTSLTQDARTAAQDNPTFILSTSSTNIGAPQIWDLNFSGNLNGGTATLVFHYDPTLLGRGVDQSKLGIWHFNKISDKWEFGGTVNTTDHTITFVTSSFSPFQVGVQSVPEPSTIALLGMGLGAIACYRVRRRGRR